MNGEAGLSDIPALMIGQADGNLILAELDAGNQVTVRLDKDLLLTQKEAGTRYSNRTHVLSRPWRLTPATSTEKISRP